MYISGQERKRIMAIIDAFSRYVKLSPLKAVTSEEAVHAFKRDFDSTRNIQKLSSPEFNIPETI